MSCEGKSCHWSARQPLSSGDCLPPPWMIQVSSVWFCLLILRNISQGFTTNKHCARQCQEGSDSHFHLEGPTFTRSGWLISSPSPGPAVGKLLCCGWGCTGDLTQVLTSGRNTNPCGDGWTLFWGHFFTGREIPYYIKSINVAEDPPSFQQIPRVPGRNYLMQLRRYNQTRYLPQIFFCTPRHNELKILNNRKTRAAIYKSILEK